MGDNDDVTVEVEDDNFEQFETEHQHPNMQNMNPNFLMASFYSVTSFLASYGWTILVVGVLLVIIWTNIEKKVKKMLQRSKERNDPIESDPEVLARRAEKMEIARQKMQERASEILKKEAERRKELEEKKRLEKLEDFDAMKAGKASLAAQRKTKQIVEDASHPSSANKVNKSRPAARPLRDNDYNPLTGTSSSTRHRPVARRSGGG